MRNVRHSLTGYKINYSNNTIIMNFKFAKSAQDFGSPEYNLLKALKADFPMMKTIVEAGRKITTTRPTKRLTYANIEQHIDAYMNSDELLEQFELVKQLSKPLASPYKYVCDWFYSQFPNYDDVSKSLKSCDQIQELVDIPNVSDYQTKDSYMA